LRRFAGSPLRRFSSFDGPVIRTPIATDDGPKLFAASPARPFAGSIRSDFDLGGPLAAEQEEQVRDL